MKGKLISTKKLLQMLRCKPGTLYSIVKAIDKKLFIRLPSSVYVNIDNIELLDALARYLARKKRPLQLELLLETAQEDTKTLINILGFYNNTSTTNIENIEDNIKEIQFDNIEEDDYYENNL